MKAIIVDDEPRAIELIEGYLQHFSAVELAGTFRNGLKAIEFLATQSVDLIFLDINMPHLSGIALSRMIPEGTKIIFTTAFSEYAVESYEVQALDYLLKPISFERFTRAMSKVMNSIDPPNADIPETKMVKSGSRIYRIDPKEILYLQKDGNYMTYHLKAKKILGRESVAEALESLPGYFIQMHKSFIINIHHIDYYNKEEVVINGFIIPIGDAFRVTFHQAMKK